MLDGASGRIRRIATLFESVSGRVMEVHSTEPGVQFYTGNYLADGAPGTGGGIYPARGGLCLEPQKFPDSPNKPDFPSARLDPGRVGLDLCAFIQVVLERPEHDEPFIAAVMQNSAILECHHVTGAWNYLMKVRLKTTRDLETFFSGVVKDVPGLQRTETLIVLSSPKDTQFLAVPEPDPA